MLSARLTRIVLFIFIVVIGFAGHAARAETDAAQTPSKAVLAAAPRPIGLQEDTEIRLWKSRVTQLRVKAAEESGRAKALAENTEKLQREVYALSDQRQLLEAAKAKYLSKEEEDAKKIQMLTAQNEKLMSRFAGIEKWMKSDVISSSIFGLLIFAVLALLAIFSIVPSQSWVTRLANRMDDAKLAALRESFQADLDSSRAANGALEQSNKLKGERISQLEQEAREQARIIKDMETRISGLLESNQTFRDRNERLDAAVKNALAAYAAHGIIANDDMSEAKASEASAPVDPMSDQVATAPIPADRVEDGPEIHISEGPDHETAEASDPPNQEESISAVVDRRFDGIIVGEPSPEVQAMSASPSEGAENSASTDAPSGENPVGEVKTN